MERAEGPGGSAIASVPGTPVRVDVALPTGSLTDQHGRRLALGELQGSTTLLTAAFGHCATVCPTVVHDLRAARLASGRTDIRLVVITLDPWRDTPERLASLATRWELGPDDLVLSGSVEEVERALDGLRISRRRDEITGDVDHLATVMLVSARGRISWRIEGGAARVGVLLGAGA